MNILSTVGSFLIGAGAALTAIELGGSFALFFGILFVALGTATCVIAEVQEAVSDIVKKENK